MPTECVKVMVRVRPMNKKEQQSQCQQCVAVDAKHNQIYVKNIENSSNDQKTFSFDNVFNDCITQQQIYEQSAFNLVESSFEGYNGTIFAYGQTGCGKTFTMMGVTDNDELQGIIPRTFTHIMSIIEADNSKQYLVRCSFIEIYNEEIHDLLGRDPRARYELKEAPDKGIFVKDLNKIIVKSVQEMQQAMNQGNTNRSVGETAMNKDSSRSHSIFTVYVEVCENVKGSDQQTSANGKQQQQRITAGKLNLVDLAGSERQSKTQSTGERLKEANKINLSLSALGNVISALIDGKSQHIPYRDSKLTRLLQDSLGGNTKTVMIAAVSPADYNHDETLSTLRYASRAKYIQNQPIINQDPKDALIKQYAEEINRLKQMLDNQKISQSNENPQQQDITNNSNHNNKDIALLKEQHNALEQDKQRIEQALKQRDVEIQNEKLEKEKLEQQLQQIQAQMFTNQTNNNTSNSDNQTKKQQQELRKKLKKQLKIQEQLIQEKRQKEEDLLLAEKNYQNLQEEVEEQRKLIKKLRKKYKQMTAEVKDIEVENAQEREDLLEGFRQVERENKLNQCILDMLLTKDEIEIIRNQAEWNDDRNSYQLPPFYLKNKKLKFPRLPMHQAADLINNEKQNREISFSDAYVLENFDKELDGSKFENITQDTTLQDYSYQFSPEKNENNQGRNCERDRGRVAHRRYASNKNNGNCNSDLKDSSGGGLNDTFQKKEGRNHSKSNYTNQIDGSNASLPNGQKGTIVNHNTRFKSQNVNARTTNLQQNDMLDNMYYGGLCQQIQKKVVNGMHLDPLVEIVNTNINLNDRKQNEIQENQYRSIGGVVSGNNNKNMHQPQLKPILGQTTQFPIKNRMSFESQSKMNAQNSDHFHYKNNNNYYNNTNTSITNQ